MTTLHNLTSAQLRKLVSIKVKIEGLEAKLHAIIGHGASAVRDGRGASKMSAAGRARIAAAQKARWAKVKARNGKTAPKKRRKMSAAGRERIAASARARWRKAKAAGRTRL